MLKSTEIQALTSAAAELSAAAKTVARCVVWVGCADIGAAPALMPPISWWLGRRTRRNIALLSRVARREKVQFIDFCNDCHTHCFSDRRTTYFTADRMHPSGAAHRYCFDALKQRLCGAGVGVEAWVVQPSAGATIARTFGSGGCIDKEAV